MKKIIFISLFCFFVALSTKALAQSQFYSWRTINTGTNLTFIKISFPDSLYGWVLSPFNILNTKDGGETWHEQNLPTENIELRDFYFSNKRTGYIIGDSGLILSTKDGGQSWHKQESGANKHLLRGINFINDSTGWITGQMDDGTKRGGILLFTNNGGLSWDTLSDRSDNILYYDVKFSDSLNGIVIGSYGVDNFTPIEVYKTDDGGKNLTHISEFDGAHAVGLKLVEKDTLWAIGFGFSKSFDGGKTWNSNYSIQLTDSIRGLLTFTDILPINSKTGWSVVANVLGPDQYSSHLYYTDSYGENWEIVSTPEGFIPFVVSYKEDYLFVAGAGGLIITNKVKPVKVDYKSIAINSFELFQNYPNPFNPTTTIKYNLDKEEKVRLTVYDILGNMIKLLVNEFQHPGYHTQIWEGKNEFGERVPSGIYFIELKVQRHSQIIKVTLIK